MVKNLIFGNLLKDGEYMTRICAVCNQNELSVSADSQFTNSLTNEKTINNLKLCYQDNMIIGILGVSEFITSNGNYSIRNHIQSFMNQYYDAGKEIEFIHVLIDDLKRLYGKYLYERPCCVIHFWKEDNICYAYYYQMYAKRNIFIGNSQVVFFTDIGNISVGNKELFDITNKMIICGDGLRYNPEFYQGEYLYPLELSISKTKEAVMDRTLTTIGGPVYSVQIQDDVHTYIDGKATRW